MLDEEVGFIAYDEEEIAWLYVDKRHRLEGTASKVIEHALKIEQCIYYVESLKGNVPARKLYEKYGFELVDTLHGHMPRNKKFEVDVWALKRSVNL